MIITFLVLALVSAETIKLGDFHSYSTNPSIDLSKLNSFQDIFKYVQLPTQGNSVSGGSNLLAGTGNLLKGDYNQLIGNSNALIGSQNGVKGSNNAAAGS